MVENYTTKAQVKAYLGSTTTKDDDAIDVLIPQCSREVERITHRVFYHTDETRTHDATRDVNRYLLFLRGDATAITTVTNGDGNTLVEGTDFRTYPPGASPFWGLQLYASKGKVWTWTDAPEDAISVEGRWGYTIEGTNTPDDIVLATTRLVSWRLFQRTRPFQATALADVGLQEVPSTMPDDIKGILRRYRRPQIARSI